MGVAATGSVDIACEIAKATAEELRSVGINWIMGPCLDVLTNVKNQPLGVRSTGDDPEEVSKYGEAFMKGFKDAGIANCGKHFPSYGNLEFLGSSLDVPVITESLEQLSLSALIPFRNAIAKGVDSMMVGGCAMSSAGVNAMHACLSEQVVDRLLRHSLGFDGVVISECLELETLSQNTGVAGGTVMAITAGCDLVLVCRSWAGQQEAFNGLKAGVEQGVVSGTRLRQSLDRMLSLKNKYVTWERALRPAGIDNLSIIRSSHLELSTKAYNNSITVVRDKNHLLPLSELLEADEELLLLTPLLKPLPASAASQALASQCESPGFGWSKYLLGGESVFTELGRSLARQRNGRILHTSYTSNGLRPLHENLIDRSSAIIVVTANANQNLYQHGLTKHVATICKLAQSSGNREKPLVVVSVSSPYDFATDASLGTYICTYDYTETAMQALVNVLVGKLIPTGALPGSLRRNHKVHQSRQNWLVEVWDEARDAGALDSLLSKTPYETPITGPSNLASCTSETFLLHDAAVEEAHFVIRNSSTRAVYGFCSTYYFPSTGVGALGCILVDPDRRKLSIGRSLHRRAMKAILQREGLKRCQLGTRLPSVFPGVPSNNISERKRLREWFGSLGWDATISRPVCSVLLKDLESWSPRETLMSSLRHADIEFDLVYGADHAESVLDVVNTSSRQGVAEIYQLALADTSGSAIIRAKRSIDGAILGTLVVYNKASSWSNAVPALNNSREVIGGISSPVISPSVGDYSTLLQGLILLGIKQHQSQQATAVLLDCVGLSIIW